MDVFSRKCKYCYRVGWFWFGFFLNYFFIKFGKINENKIIIISMFVNEFVY